MITITQRGDHWQVSFYYDCPKTNKRKRFRRNAPYPTKRKAYQWGMEQYELAHSAKAPVEVPTYARLVELYRERLAPTKLKDSEEYVRKVRTDKHLIPRFGEMRIDDINALAIDGYIIERKKEGAAPSTINRELTALSSHLKAGHRWEMLDRLPDFQWMDEPEPQVRYLTEDEAARLVEACRTEPMLENLVPFVLHTGLRTSEFVALRWDDIDLRRKQVSVRQAKARAKTESPKSKSSARTIPLNDIAISALKAQKVRTFMRGGLVFTAPDGSALTKNKVKLPWARAIKKAGIRHCTRHDLRHTFASWLVQRGVSLQTVRDLMGHADIKTTTRYAHLAPKNLSDATTALLDFGNEMGTNKKSG